MSERERATIALIISTLSLVLSAYFGFRDFKEKAVVLVNDIEVDAVDLERGNYIDFSAEVIVANISKTTMSFIKASAYVGWNECELLNTPEIPITLVQGYADKIKICFRYPLSKEQVEELVSGNEIDEVLSHKTISIHLQSARNKSFSGGGIQVKSVH